MAVLMPIAGSGDSKLPGFDKAMALPAVDLAKAYDTARIILGFLPSVKQDGNTTIVARGRTINQENADDMTPVVVQELATYETAIQKRGYKTISGQYRAKATPQCARIGSYWTRGIAEGVLRDVEVKQNGFQIQLVQTVEYEGQSSTYELEGVIVESALTFSGAANSDFVFLGQIELKEIEVRPDVDAVLGYWPKWAGPPRRKDLSACRVILSSNSR